MQIKDFESTIEKLKPFLPTYLEEKGIDTKTHFLCPFPDHDDCIPSCKLVGNNTRGYCHGCGRSFDIFDVVQLMEDKPKIGTEWIEGTLKYLAKKYDVDVVTSAMSEKEAYRLDAYRAYRAASKLLCGIGQEDNALFQKELKTRKWKAEALTSMGIGVIKSYDRFISSLRSQGFTSKFLEEIGLTKRDLFNSGSLIYTWYDLKDRPIGFVARNMAYEVNRKKAELKGEVYKAGKYTNTRTTKLNLFQKGKNLYGLNEALRHSSPLYIFEGQPDVVSARCAGLNSVVAIGGSAFRDDHIQLLKENGIYDVVLCFDGDDTGRKKLEETLENRFAGDKDIRVRVIELPDGEDPDSYIRKNGISDFRALACWSAFEWKLNKYDENEDEITICQSMIPYIVSEPSPVVRDQLCKILASRTGVEIKAIEKELDLIFNKDAQKKKKEKQNILDKAMYELRNDPENAQSILQKAQNNLQDLVKEHSEDILSSEDFIRSIDQQKIDEEKMTIGETGFKLGKDLKELEDAFRGDWSEGVFICIGGKPNSGKTGFLTKFAYSIAENNEDALVIYHTIDDTLEQIVPRFVTIAEGSQKLSINMVRQPKYWAETVGLEHVNKRREEGYKSLRKLAQENRLVIKDVKHGSSLPFIENLICYFQDKYPEKRIVFILDNFHKLRDFEGKEERVRFKAISEAVKNITLRRKCCFVSSVEYTKLPAGIRPTNNNIGESGQIEYDASAIVHIYNDVADNPDSFTVCHEGMDWKGKMTFLPRPEFIIGKNKITEIKKSFFLDFYPASSDYKSVNQSEVLKEAQNMAKLLKEKGGKMSMMPEELGEVY